MALTHQIANYFRNKIKNKKLIPAERHSDIVIVVGFAVIICLLVLPISPGLLDIFIGINIIIGIMLILIAIYISRPTDFSVFPSLLLMTTLYRLSLSVATTRIILTKAEAGKIIDVFGNFTAAGNIVVGLVVFTIITVVQFVVVAKGADRVAEVAARFSLDAMPGKQMSIDSDLRAGLTDKEESRRRRKLLELEGRLHGGLDGAMKFVKGDAMAGIVIIIINLVGGLSVGMLQRGLSFDQAIQTYSVLTIGDGMVNQIPALLAAMAAALLVTRISDDDHVGHLGQAVQRQMFQNPRAVLVAGMLCWAMALVPGFPAGIFLIMGFIGVTMGIWGDHALREKLASGYLPFKAWLDHVDVQRAGQHGSAVPAPTAVTPLVLAVDGVAENSPDWSLLVRALGEVLTGFDRRLGVALPPVTVRAEFPEAPLAWRFFALELQIDSGTCTQETPIKHICKGVEEALRRNLTLFMGVQEASILVQRTMATYPEVCKEATRVLPITRIAEVLRLLLEEEVSLRNLHLILDKLAEVGQNEKDGQALAALVRIAVSRHMSAPYQREGVINAIALNPVLERQLRDGLKSRNGLALDPGAGRSLISNLKRLSEGRPSVVILCPLDLRRPLRRLIAGDLFDLPVFAHQEISGPTRLKIVGQAPPLSFHAAEAAA